VRACGFQRYGIAAGTSRAPGTADAGRCSAGGLQGARETASKGVGDVFIETRSNDENASVLEVAVFIVGGASACFSQ